MPLRLGSLNRHMDTLTLHRPSEALILVPHFIGFRPHHHMVFLGLDQRETHSDDERVAMGPVMVLDTDEFGIEPETGILLARTVRDYRVTRAVLVLYCEDLLQGFDYFKRAFANTCAMAGDAMRSEPGGFFECFVADGDNWAAFTGEDLELHPWSELDASPAAAAMVYAGSAPPEERPTYELVRRGHDARNQACAAGDEWLTANRGQLIARGSTLWDELIADWEDPGHREGINRDVARLGRANAALSVVGVRDRILLWCTSPDRRVAEMSEEQLLDGYSETAVAPVRVTHLENMVELLEECAKVADLDDPAALSCAAYCLWWYGQNTRAAERLLEAMEADPNYTLAELLLDAVNAAILPLWLTETEEE